MKYGFLLNILGLCGFIGSMGILWTGTSLFADFRTERIAGPGVDIRVIDRYPEAGESFEFELTARGGSAAGISRVVAMRDHKTIKDDHGAGVTWGSRVSGKSRGSESLLFDVPVDLVSTNGEPIEFTVVCEYVCAMSSSGMFTNDRFTDVVNISLPRQSKMAQFIDLLISLTILIVWILASMFARRLWVALEADAVSHDDNETIAISGIGIYMFFVFLGHYVFSTRVVGVIGVSSDFVLYGLTITWAAVPFVVAFVLRRSTLSATCAPKKKERAIDRFE